MAARKRRNGVQFELAVAAVQSLLDPSTTVTHNEVLRDRLGHNRQFDVVIRGKLGGHEILGVIECKDLSRPVGTPDVNAFADKASNLRANVKIIASSRGFTKPALELATHHGIGTISLVQEAPNAEGVSIALPSYATIHEWTRYRILFPDGLPDGVDIARPASITWHAEPITNWAMWAMKTFEHLRETGRFAITVGFRQPISLMQGSAEFSVRRFVVVADRVVTMRSKLVQWHGKAFYEWSSGKVLYPGQTEFVSAWYRSDLSDWDAFEGNIPALLENNPFDVRVELFRSPSLPAPPLNLADFATVEIAICAED